MFIQAVAALFIVAAISGEQKLNTDICPVIVSPEQGDRAYSGDNLALRYYGGEDTDYYVVLSEGKRVIKVEKVESGTVMRSSGGNTHRVGSGGLCILDESLFEPEKSYTLRIGRGLKFSNPVTITTFTGGEEAIRQILERNSFNPQIKGTLEKIAPHTAFTGSAKAAQMMETITVRIWRMDEDGKKFPSSAKLTVNKNLRNNYINAFNELYALSFPINSVGCYNYRKTYGGRLSEHALGTAVDINPMQNYCLYSDGTTVGELWEPYKNPYSVTPEVVAVFKKYGFGWGGDWGDTPDYMHFSYFNS